LTLHHPGCKFPHISACDGVVTAGDGHNLAGEAAALLRRFRAENSLVTDAARCNLAQIQETSI
jgi:hypothetical protein